MNIYRASLDDLDYIVPLFNSYRIFYGQHDNTASARDFIGKRLLEHSSVIFLCSVESVIAGFVQLFPSYSSISVCDVWILNDLFVLPEYRKRGIARGLIAHAISFSRETGRKKIVLSTACNNLTAQKIYKQSGFIKMNFIPYEFVIE